MVTRQFIMNVRTLIHTGIVLVGCALNCHAEIKVTTERNTSTLPFRFDSVPAPASNDAATKARFTLVDGERDRNGGELDALHDGRVPTEEDQPSENFFFVAGTDGGRLAVDLGSEVSIKRINTYSWHGGTRGPQVYKLYGADGTATGFDAAPKRGTAPVSCGWTLIATVDSRTKDGDGGGQHGVSVVDSSTGTVGKFRHLLFDVFRTETRDAFGNTFFSEIDVIDANGPAPTSALAGEG